MHALRYNDIKHLGWILLLKRSRVLEILCRSWMCVLAMFVLLIYQVPYDGIKGFKDEIAFLKPLLQKFMMANMAIT